MKMNDSRSSCQWLSTSGSWYDGYIRYESGKLKEAVLKYMELNNAMQVVVFHSGTGASVTFKRS